MKLSWLWFDLDNTLLDFSGASKRAFKSLFADWGLPDAEASYPLYREVNNGYWKQFEQGEVTAMDIKKRRFTDFFDRLGAKGLDGYEANKIYLDYLIKHSEIYPGALELLQELRQHYKLSIITNGLKEVQRPRLHNTGIYSLFDSIIVSDEIGYSKPNREIFQHVYDSLPLSPAKKEIMIIGDSWNSDMKGGKNFGIHTCWLTDTIDPNNEWEANFVIRNISELRDILLKDL